MKSIIVDVQKGNNIVEKEYSIKELIESVNLMLGDKESYVKLYITDSDDYLAIFSWQARNKWKIDFPIELNRIHSQRYVTKQQCLKVLRKIYETENIDGFKGFIDVPVRHFTLDEMLEFQKEDAMLLKGNDPF